MRPVSALVCVCVPLAVGGAIAAGCIDNTAVPPPGVDAGFSFDGGVLFDSAAPTDATIASLLDGGDGGAATLDFGLVGCGTGTTRTFSFTNPGPASVEFSASIATGSVFSVVGDAGAGTIASGKSGSITIAVAPIPTTSVAGEPLTATMTVTTNAPGLASFEVPLKVIPQGGSLTVSPAVAGFGQVQISTSAPTIPLTITNSGNAPVTLTFGAPGAGGDGGVDPDFGIFYAGSPGGTTIVANGVAGAGATFLPTAPGARSVALAIQTNDPLCASPATAIAMSGTGSPAQVNVGPDPLQFGAVPCGQSGAPLQVTITNASRGAITFTDSLGLGAGSPFTVDVTSGTVPGELGDAGTAVITVTPKAIVAPASVMAGAFNDTLVVIPSSPFVQATTITLQESASGAILALAMDGGMAFGTVGESQAPTLPFTVTNTGNVDAPLLVGITGAGYDAGFASPPATATADGGAASGTVTFSPTTSGLVDGTLSVSTTAPLCSLPPSLLLSATGSVPVASFPTTPVAASATCGGAVTQGTLTITNTGGTPLVISAAASTSGAFTVVSSPTAPIAVGSSGVITIQAVALGQGTAGGSTIGDTLTFTTNEPGNPSRSVPVAVGVVGANLAYVGASGDTITFDAPSCGPQSYFVSNTGNLPATVVATGSYPNDPDDSDDDETVFTFGGAFAKSTVVGAGAQVGDTVDLAVGNCQSLACSVSGTQAFTSENASGDAVGICIPLPALDLTLFYCNCFSQGC